MTTRSRWQDVSSAALTWNRTAPDWHQIKAVRVESVRGPVKGPRIRSFTVLTCRFDEQSYMHFPSFQTDLVQPQVRLAGL